MFPSVFSDTFIDVTVELRKGQSADLAIVYNMQSFSNNTGTCRQRSGKSAIRKIFPLQKPRWENLN